MTLLPPRSHDGVSDTDQPPIPTRLVPAESATHTFSLHQPSAIRKIHTAEPFNLTCRQLPRYRLDRATSVKMKLNISYPANGSQKIIEIDDERKLRPFMEKRMGTEVSIPVSPISSIHTFSTIRNSRRLPQIRTPTNLHEQIQLRRTNGLIGFFSFD